jgi:hypothetical protein
MHTFNGRCPLLRNFALSGRYGVLLFKVIS